MTATINGLPVYDALISDNECGMIRISLVDDPAVMSNFQTFASQKKPQLFSVMDEERRLARGCVMRANFPIYRRDGEFEYYIVYKPETIRVMAEKYLAESRQNEVNTMHRDGSDVDGVQMVQYFIKGDGISVEGFDDCADGSLFAEFHVTNDVVWDAIKEGTYRGFSLEGIFAMEPDEEQDEVDEIVSVLDGAFSKIFKNTNMSKVSRFKAALAKLLQEFGNVTTDKGIITWDGEDDLKEGDEVFIEDAEGERVPAADGDYTTEDGKVIVVVDGKVAEIKDAEAEVAPEVEETPDAEVEAEGEEEEAPEAEDERDARIAELEAENESLRARIAELEAENAALTEEIAKIKQMSIARPAHEEVKESETFQKTGIRGLDNLARILNAR